MGYVPRTDVLHTRFECKPRVKPAFFSVLPFADGGPAVRLIHQAVTILHTPEEDNGDEFCSD